MSARWIVEGRVTSMMVIARLSAPSFGYAFSVSSDARWMATSSEGSTGRLLSSRKSACAVTARRSVRVSRRMHMAHCKKRGAVSDWRTSHHGDAEVTETSPCTQCLCGNRLPRAGYQPLTSLAPRQNLRLHCFRREAEVLDELLVRRGVTEGVDADQQRIVVRVLEPAARTPGF